MEKFAPSIFINGGIAKFLQESNTITYGVDSLNIQCIENGTVAVASATHRGLGIVAGSCNVDVNADAQASSSCDTECVLLVANVSIVSLLCIVAALGLAYFVRRGRRKHAEQQPLIH